MTATTATFTSKQVSSVLSAADTFLQTPNLPRMKSSGPITIDLVRSKIEYGALTVPVVVIEDITVAPDYRGNGWFISVVRGLIERAGALGLHLYVMNVKTDDVPTWTRLGFIPHEVHIDTGRRYIWVSRNA